MKSSYDLKNESGVGFGWLARSSDYDLSLLEVNQGLIVLAPGVQYDVELNHELVDGSETPTTLSSILLNQEQRWWTLIRFYA